MMHLPSLSIDEPFFFLSSVDLIAQHFITVDTNDVEATGVAVYRHAVDWKESDVSWESCGSFRGRVSESGVVVITLLHPEHPDHKKASKSSASSKRRRTSKGPVDAPAADHANDLDDGDTDPNVVQDELLAGAAEDTPYRFTPRQLAF
jgi:hypothetical protein